MKDNGHRTAETQTGSAECFGHQFYRALASRERRRILSLLLDGEERSVEDVATLIVGWDAATDAANEPEDRERAHLRLVHAHLPMLDEAGLVTYDPEQGTVRISALDTDAVEYLERSVDGGDGESAPG